MSTASEVETDVAAVAKAAVPVVTMLSPTAGAILSLVAAAIAETPALIAELESLLSTAKAPVAPVAPLTFAKDSAALAAALDAP